MHEYQSCVMCPMMGSNRTTVIPHYQYGVCNSLDYSEPVTVMRCSGTICPIIGLLSPCAALWRH